LHEIASNALMLNPFVKMLANWSSLLTNGVSISFDCTFYLIKWQSTSTYLVRS
jgi:hypothetical protein